MTAVQKSARRRQLVALQTRHEQGHVVAAARPWQGATHATTTAAGRPDVHGWPPGRRACKASDRLRLHDPDIAAVADRLLELSTGRFDLVSGCGHVRGEIIGDGTLELLTRRDRGETVYLARKRPPAASS